MLDKRSRLARWLHGDGIEIGALHRPLVVPEDAHVTYVDRFPEDELRRHYPELADQAFAPVSVLGTAEDLSAFGDRSLDFVIANHLLEHLEDPIRGLKEFDRVLKPDGVLYLALPDPRVSFDRDRALTTVDHLLDEHRNGTQKNRPDHYLDWSSRVDKARDPDARAKDLMAMDYSIHFHVWQPDTFLEFFLTARREAGLRLEIADFAPPEHASDDEFIMVLLEGASPTLRLPRGGSPRPAVPPRTLRSRVASSPIAPLIRPAYRGIRRLLVRAPRNGRPR